MFTAAAAFAFVWSLAIAPNVRAEDPVAYEAVIAAEAAAQETAETEDGSTESALTSEQQSHMAGAADWSARATLYHAGGGGATGNDSLGCRPIPYRTIATDPRVIPRRTRVFIRETLGLRLPDGTIHDGYWYASDTGGVVRGAKVDLYTGHGRASMRPVMPLNTRHLSVVEAGRFQGCPPSWDAVPSQADVTVRVESLGGSR